MVVMRFVGSSHSLVPPSQLRGLAERRESLIAELAELRNRGSIRGAVLLSTCNRVELLYDPGPASPTAISPATMRELFLGDSSKNLPCIELEDQAAVEHMLRVATGLESAVVGEEQILGQLSRAFKTADDLGMLSRPLYRLRNRLLATARDLRNRAGLGARRVSMAAVAARQLRHAGPRIAVVGAGETGRLALDHLSKFHQGEVIIVNRTFKRAEALAAHFGATPMALDEFLAAPPTLDGVIFAVHSDTPMVGPEQAKKLGQIIDISQPSVVSPQVYASAGHRVLSLDDMGRIASEETQRQAEASDAGNKLAKSAAARLWEDLQDQRPNYGKVVGMHIELAVAEVEQALAGGLRHLADSDRDRVRDMMLRTAKRNAHYHIQDLKRYQIAQ